MLGPESYTISTPNRESQTGGELQRPFDCKCFDPKKQSRRLRPIAPGHQDRGACARLRESSRTLLGRFTCCVPHVLPGFFLCSVCVFVCIWAEDTKI